MNIKDNDSIIEQVSFVNEAFYLAFESKDLSAMESIWADREDIYCLHPGWHPLTGRKNILESWGRILSNEAQPRIWDLVLHLPPSKVEAAFPPRIKNHECQS